MIDAVQMVFVSFHPIPNLYLSNLRKYPPLGQYLDLRRDGHLLHCPPPPSPPPPPHHHHHHHHHHHSSPRALFTFIITIIIITIIIITWWILLRGCE